MEVLELNMKPDHVHLVVSLPPKYAVSEFLDDSFATQTEKFP